jgi:hypothetical protein
MIANLQAQAGDFAGARQTAESIPSIKRSSFPGPSDGFYDAIKPATLAMNAQIQAEAGDRAGASEAFHRAIELSRVIETGGEKVVAQIVIIEKQIACGEGGSARALLDEAIPFALKQPEPLRSRGLAMLVASQVKAADLSGAAQTTIAIRDTPGLEKRRALGALADWYENAGDHVSAQTFLRQALKYAEAKAPDNAPAVVVGAKVAPPLAITARSFIDFEAEMIPGVIENAQSKQMGSMFLHARLGHREEAVRIARAMPAGMRTIALSNLAGQFVRQGDMTGAMNLASSLESQEERLTAIQLVACAIRDRRPLK